MNHAALPVINLDRAEAFYALLGYRRVGEWKHPEHKARGVNLSNESGLNIELVVQEGYMHGPRQSPIASHVGISVPDLDMTLAALHAKGITPELPPVQGITVAQYCFLRDPDGNAIELFEEHSS